MYRLNSAANDGWGEYRFSPDGLSFDVFIHALGTDMLAIDKVKLVPSVHTSGLYSSTMTFATNNSTTVFSRYVHTGMQFSEDYSEITIDKSVDGPYFAYMPTSLAALVHVIYNADRQHYIQKAIELGDLITDPESELNTPMLRKS